MWSRKRSAVQNPRLPVGGGVILVALELWRDSYERERVYKGSQYDCVPHVGL